MKHRVARIVLAVFFAPLAIVPIILIFALLTDFPEMGQSAYWEWLLLFAAFGLVIAFPITTVLGLPAYFLLLHRGHSSYLKFGLAGLVIAGIGQALFFEPLRDANNVGFLILITICGAAVALAFRGIAGAPSVPDVTRALSAN